MAIRTAERFRDRPEAGRELGEELHAFAGREDVIVLGLPRGGVPIAYEVARALRAPLDVFVVRKLGVPGREELALGAIASGGVRVLNSRLIAALELPEDWIESIHASERRELERRERIYRGSLPAPELRGRTAILVDDGLATGSTMTAAVEAVRCEEPAEIVVAVPVADPEVCARLGRRAEEVVCLRMPLRLGAVGLYYEDFSQTSDEQVRALLAAARRPPAGGAAV
jgi:putative phosphoribosyl transferase